MKHFEMNKQRGMTIIGFIFVLAMLVTLLIFVMKLYPAYSEYYSIRAGMKTVAHQPGVASLPPPRIRNLIMRNFHTSYVKVIGPKDVKLVTRKGEPRISVKYEVREPLFANIDVVMKFEHTELLGNQ